jgi:PEGA domain
VAPSGSQPSSGSGGGAQPRPTGSASASTPAGSGGARALNPTGGAPPPGSAGTARPRYGAPTQGQAVGRPPGYYPVYPYYPIYPYYGYPYYGGGFGYGYYGYNPWWYGGYMGYSYYGSGGGGYADTGGGAGESYTSEIAMGSIRLRASPSKAKVYVDGTLMGIVDDFDGLSNHLDLSAGQHELELRADGYETYTGTINVLLGKTLTERVTLKKK